MATRAKRVRAAVLLTGSLCIGAASLAESPRTVVGQPPPSAPPQTLAPQQPPYNYQAEGRRDPFVSLLNRGTDGRASGKGAEGLAGMLANELSLKGIMQSRGQYVALVQGPDTKTYVARPNDRLFDGRIKSITADDLIITQEVNDPLSLTKQREIRKLLHALDAVK